MPRFLKNCCRFARRVSSTPRSCADLLRRNARGGVVVLRVRRGLSAAIESSVVQPGFTAYSRQLLCELGKDGRRRRHFLANRHPRTATHRQIHIDPRSEADKAITLATIKRLANVDVAQNAPRDQSGDL